jgi:hypothetical protein
LLGALCASPRAASDCQLTWVNLAAARGDLSGAGARMVYDTWRNVSVVYGGDCCSLVTYEHDGAAWRSAPANSEEAMHGDPPQRPPAIRHGMAFDEARGVTILFGDRYPPIGSIDGDGSVGLTDLAQLLSDYGDASGTHALGDLNRDGDVDMDDLAELLEAFGSVCP